MAEKKISIRFLVEDMECWCFARNESSAGERKWGARQWKFEELIKFDTGGQIDLRVNGDDGGMWDIKILVNTPGWSTLRENSSNKQNGKVQIALIK